jgi:hypothetical protein
MPDHRCASTNKPDLIGIAKVPDFAVPKCGCGRLERRSTDMNERPELRTAGRALNGGLRVWSAADMVSERYRKATLCAIAPC